MLILSQTLTLTLSLNFYYSFIQLVALTLSLPLCIVLDAGMRSRNLKNSPSHVDSLSL